MNDEPARIVSLISAAITATVGVLTLLGVWSGEVGGALAVAAAAWVAVGGELIRSKVWPTAHVRAELARAIRPATAAPIIVGEEGPEYRRP